MDLLCTERLNPSYAFKDAVIFNDERVLNEMLNLESIYIPRANYLDNEVQSEMTSQMRTVLTKWMLEVCNAGSPILYLA